MALNINFATTADVGNRRIVLMQRSIPSTWNRKRWKAYSKKVQNAIPTMKHTLETARPYSSLPTIAIYVTTGSQIIGMTYLYRSKENQKTCSIHSCGSLAWRWMFAMPPS